MTRYLLKSVERYFAVLAVAATLLGLIVPVLGWPFRIVAIPLMGILFFSGLKLDFAAAMREFRKPAFLLYVSIMCMVVLPIGMWLLARWALPEFALGILILALMPAGMAGGPFTDIARGNTALAMVIVLVTSLLCPLVIPSMIGLVTGELAQGGYLLLAYRAAYLAGILFVPMAAAWLVRRRWPESVARHRDAFTGASVVFVLIVILGSMSVASEQCMGMVRSEPFKVVRLAVFLFGFSAIFHVAGYWIAPWRPIEDRAALSICAAYVNNGLGIVFAQTFFVPHFGVEAMLPAVLLEIPMTLAIPVIAWYIARRKGKLAIAPSPV